MSASILSITADILCEIIARIRPFEVVAFALMCKRIAEMIRNCSERIWREYTLQIPYLSNLSNFMFVSRNEFWMIDAPKLPISSSGISSISKYRRELFGVAGRANPFTIYPEFRHVWATSQVQWENVGIINHTILKGPIKEAFKFSLWAPDIYVQFDDQQIAYHHWYQNLIFEIFIEKRSIAIAKLSKITSRNIAIYLTEVPFYIDMSSYCIATITYKCYLVETTECANNQKEEINPYNYKTITDIFIPRYAFDTESEIAKKFAKSTWFVNGWIFDPKRGIMNSHEIIHSKIGLFPSVDRSADRSVDRSVDGNGNYWREIMAHILRAEFGAKI